MTLRNIPPLWEAIAHWAAVMLYAGLLPKRLKLWQYSAAAVFSLVILSLFVTTTGGLSGIAFNLAKTALALLTLLQVFALCRVRRASGFYYCARAFILAGLAASLGWQLYLYAAGRYEFMDTVWAEWIFMLAVYAGVFGVVLLVERRHEQELQEMPVPVSAAAAAVVMAVVIYVFSSLSYAAPDTPFSAETDEQIYNIRTIVYFGGVAILLAFHLQLCQTHTLQEVKSLNTILQMQYANYQISEETIDMVNRKYHDLKHLIHLLRADISEGEKKASLDRVEEEIRTYEAQNKTGNKVLDTILTAKSNHCANNGIQLTCVADGEALSFLDVMDLSTIFGNALDNAIEGVSQIPEPEERLIHLSVSRERGFLRIRVENRCREDLKVKGGLLPITTKSDKRFHGYGLKSIFMTAEKYGGSAAVLAENGWFELRILIPLPDDKIM